MDNLSIPSTNSNAIAVSPFDFEGAQVRIIVRDGDPWFVLADACRILEIGNPSQAASRLDKDEKHTLTTNEGMVQKGPQSLITINESGLYSLVVTSRKPSAKRFKKWVTSEVLPSIRKTGSYGQDPMELLADPASLRQLLSGYAERVEVLEAKVEEAQPKVSFYDDYANSDGLFGLQNAARVLSQGPNKFVRWLKQDYLFYQGTALVPRVQYIQQGIFEVITTIVDDKARPRTFVTPKGIQYFAERFGVVLEGQRPPLRVTELPLFGEAD